MGFRRDYWWDDEMSAPDISDECACEVMDPLVDTWWQTETGGIHVCPLPGAVPTKPGSATLLFFGIELAVIRDDCSNAAVDEGGWLVIKRPWPGLMRRVYGDADRFKRTSG